MTIGERLSPTLQELDNLLWEFEYNYPNDRPGYRMEGFRGAIKVFMSALLDKMWLHQEELKMSPKDREQQVIEAGTAISEIIFKYTGIDSKTLYFKQ